jgi:hypothetical protein
MENFFDLLFQPIRNLGENVLEFMPNLLAMIIIIAGGIFISWLVYHLFLRLAGVIGFDTWCDRTGLTAVIRKGDLSASPTEITGRILFWMLVVIFGMIGLSALRLSEVNQLISQFFLYLPRFFSALAVIIIGYIVSGFLSRAVLIAAVNSGYHYARLLSETARLLLMVLVLAMALEQLAIAPNIVTAAFSIIFGGIVLALAIAFGVGGIEAARKIMEERADEEEGREARGRMEHL